LNDVVVELFHGYSHWWGCDLNCEVGLIFMCEGPKELDDELVF